jgi:hypothetical protein
MHESGKKHPTIRTLQQQRTEKTKNGNRTSQLYNRHTTQHNTLTRVLYNRHTSNTHAQPRVPYTRHTAHNNARPRASYTRHTAHKHARPRAPYTRHTAHNNARPRVSYTRHTAHKDIHKTRPHHHAHITTAKDIPHEGVNRSQTQFKKRVERFSDRPSDRVDSTHTHTHPMPKRLLPSHGMKSKGTRIEKSDGILNPIHPCDVTPSASRMRKAHSKTNQIFPVQSS